jgi:hypothetical protein
MKFAIDFTHPKTGERRTVFIELDNREAADVRRILALRGPGGPGGANGPVAKGYALKHAYQKLPDGFLHDEIILVH